MTALYIYFAELAKQIEIPANGILSRTLHHLKHGVYAQTPVIMLVLLLITR